MHPVLLAIYLPLQLFAANPHAVDLGELFIALLAASLPPLLLLALARVLRRDTTRLALLLSLAAVAFFSYGIVRNATAGRSFLGLAIVSDTFLLIAYAMAVSLGTLAILLTSRSRAVVAGRGLNSFSFALVALVLLYAAGNWIFPPSAQPEDQPHSDRTKPDVEATAAYSDGAPRSSETDSRGVAVREAVPAAAPAGVRELPAAASEPGGLPDIYYIVLDGYGRDDTLLDRYGFDNSEFLTWLESRGFYIARESSPNYISTIESLASSLNLRYLEASRGETDPGKTASIRATLHRRIQDAEATRFLRQRGYRIVAFDTGLTSTSLRRADLFLKPSFGLGEYHLELVGLTILAPLTKKVHDLHASRIHFILEELVRLGGMPGPKFVFAHLMVPHPPYVFDREGHRVPGSSRLSFREERLPHDVYVGRYTDQVRFINSEMRRVIDAILKTSRTPPVVIVQGDHGPGFNSGGQEYIEERARILNAYCLPDGGSTELYPSISPVNTFRILFQRYFRADLTTLPDGYVLGGRPTLFARH